MTVESVRVGGRVVTMDQARTWVSAYFNAEANALGRDPYAFPAYDNLNTQSSPDKLNDGDLLAPTLLNVPVSISTFYRLQSLRPALEHALESTDLQVTLASAVDDGSIGRRVEEFVGVLDTSPARGVRLTTLTKVLHRKRPVFMPLHDKFVKACYLGDNGHPVAPSKTRSWARYWTEVMLAMDADLRRQNDAWEELLSLAAGAPILRVLDVVAWREGRRLSPSRIPIRGVTSGRSEAVLPTQAVVAEHGGGVPGQSPVPSGASVGTV